MKKLLALFTSLLMMAGTVLHAQDCDAYFPMDVGTKMEITSYNPKDKVESVSQQEIKEKRAISGGMEVDVYAVVKDKKGDNIGESDYTMRCEDGTFYIDLKTLISAAQMEQYGQMDMTVDGEDLQMPPNPEVGQKLPDASLTMSFSSGGLAVMTITVNITNRRVLAKEKRTTPAGTFECIVFEQDVQTTMGGIIPMKIKSSSKEWYARGTGMVRSESYNEKGKLESYSELTAFSR